MSAMKPRLCPLESTAARAELTVKRGTGQDAHRCLIQVYGDCVMRILLVAVSALALSIGTQSFAQGRGGGHGGGPGGGHGGGHGGGPPAHAQQGGGGNGGGHGRGHGQ